MKGRKIVLLLLAVFFYGAAVPFCQCAADDAKRTYLLLSEPIDAARAEEIFRREASLADPTGFCFWGEKQEQRVSCRKTGGTAEVTRVLLSGNPGLLEAGELAWQSGCFLDEATARALFATADCSEQKLWYQGRSYRVFGTFSAKEPTMLAAAEKSDGFLLDRCVLQVSPEKGQQAARQFLLRWGLVGERIDFYPLWVAVYDFLLVLPGLLLGRAIGCCVRRIRRGNRKGPVLLLLVLAALLLQLCRNLRFPPDMFPARWSDFSFWGRWLRMQAENIRKILLTPMGGYHLQMLLDMVKSVLSNTAALLLALWTFRREIYENTAD